MDHTRVASQPQAHIHVQSKICAAWLIMTQIQRKIG